MVGEIGELDYTTQERNTSEKKLLEDYHPSGRIYTPINPKEKYCFDGPRDCGDLEEEVTGP